MANWCGVGRSNYFKVRDNEAFADFMEQTLTSMTAQYDVEKESWWIRLTDENGFDWNSSDEDGGIDHISEFASHLQENEIAIFIEIGAEKLRYLTGFALGIAWNGELTQLNLNEIYELVFDKYGITPCRAEY